MEGKTTDHLAEPRIENGRLLLIAGLEEREQSRVPEVWERFGPYMGSVPTETGWYAYGVCTESNDGTFSYIAGVEVERVDELPDEMASVLVPAGRYAVFVHRGNVSSIHETFDAIHNSWQPNTSHEVLGTPFFERYGEEFDPLTGLGGVEIWIPIK